VGRRALGSAAAGGARLVNMRASKGPQNPRRSEAARLAAAPLKIPRLSQQISFSRHARLTVGRPTPT
jgi:hypothetical protein